MAPPDKRKPAVVATTGSLWIGNAGSNSETDHTEAVRDLQAARLQRRFVMSLPLARTVAFLTYGGAA